MQEIAERELQGRLKAPVHAPPYWSNHMKVVTKLVEDYLPEETEERVTEERVRCIIITHYIFLGRSAEETREYLAERGYDLTENAIYGRANKLNHRADQICRELGICKPEKKDKRPRFDRHQWEQRFRITKARIPAVGQGKLMGAADLAAEGYEDAVVTLLLYNNLSQQMLCRLGPAGKLFFWQRRQFQQNQKDFAPNTGS